MNVVYGGVLGEAGRESLRLAVAELRRTVDAREADVLLLRYLDTESLLYGVATEEAPAVLRQRFVRPATRWHMDLGESLEETLRSRSAKVRENARRIARRIAADFGSSAAVRVFREAGELEVLARDIDKVASVSYQRPGRALFGRDGLERALTRLGLERGWFRGYILYLGGEPAAFWTGFLYGGVFGWRGATGYDPRLARYSPGAHLMTRLIDHLCAEGARVFDLGRGDLQYKRWLASGFQHEVDVRIHAARPAEVAVGLASSAVNATHALVRTVGSLADRDGRLRRKLQRRSAPQRLAGP